MYDFTDIFKGIADTHDPRMKHSVVYRESAVADSAVTKTHITKVNRDKIVDIAFISGLINIRKHFSRIKRKGFNESAVFKGYHCVHFFCISVFKMNIYIIIFNNSVIVFLKIRYVIFVIILTATAFRENTFCLENNASLRILTV